jgi:hypothetical protein
VGAFGEGLVQDGKNKVTLPRGQASFIPSGFAVMASMPYSGRNLIPCLCYWDGAQSLLPVR